MDDVAAQRHLHHWLLALGDGDKARRIGATQFVQANAIGERHLARVGFQHHIAAAPHHHWRDHVARAGGVIVEHAQHRVGGEQQAEFFVQFAQSRLLNGFAFVASSAGQRPLARVRTHLRGTTAQQERGSTGDASHQPIEAGHA